jgi:ParB family transcriptional regulator, chromosome partitioning protein
MTDNHTETPGTAAEARPSDDEIGEIQLVNPRDLIIGINTRTEVSLRKEFVEDIRARGVREPIAVRRNVAGQLVVRKGQQRTLGAIEAGRDRVPVYIEPGLHAGPDASEAAQLDRIIDQLGENEHRQAITAADEVRATQDMLNLGLSAEQMADARNIPRARAKVLHRVATDRRVVAALDKYSQLGLDQAAALADFSTDKEDREAFKALTVTALKEPEQFEHVLQRAVDDKAIRQATAAQEQLLRETGVRLLTAEILVEFPDAAELGRLRPSTESVPGTALEEDAHTSCPGHAAVVQVERTWNGPQQVRVVYYCTAPTEHAHAPRWDASHATKPGGKMTDEQKAERREVIENNKAWRSATIHRLNWLKEFLARPVNKMPTDAQVVLARTRIRSHCQTRAMENDHALACQLLGLAEPPGRYSTTPHPIMQALENASEKRAAQISLAMTLAAYDAATGEHSWRNRSSEDKEYFQLLQRWGYTLSPVEELAAGRTPTQQDVEPVDLAEVEADAGASSNT